MIFFLNNIIIILIIIRILFDSLQGVGLPSDRSVNLIATNFYIDTSEIKWFQH